MNSNMLSVSLQLPQFHITSIFVLGRVAGRLNDLIARFKNILFFQVLIQVKCRWLFIRALVRSLLLLPSFKTVVNNR